MPPFDVLVVDAESAVALPFTLGEAEDFELAFIDAVDRVDAVASEFAASVRSLNIAAINAAIIALSKGLSIGSSGITIGNRNGKCSGAGALGIEMILSIGITIAETRAVKPAGLGIGTLGIDSNIFSKT